MSTQPDVYQVAQLTAALADCCGTENNSLFVVISEGRITIHPAQDFGDSTRMLAAHKELQLWRQCVARELEQLNLGTLERSQIDCRGPCVIRVQHVVNAANGTFETVEYNRPNAAPPEMVAHG